MPPETFFRLCLYFASLKNATLLKAIQLHLYYNFNSAWNEHMTFIMDYTDV